MGAIDLPGTRKIKPAIKQDTGIREKLFCYPDKSASEAAILNEETVRVINHLNAKLSKDFLVKIGAKHIDSKGGLKDKLFGIIGSNYRELLNGFLSTAEEDIYKYFRENEYKEIIVMDEITGLLESIGKAGKFDISPEGKQTGEQVYTENLETHTNGRLSSGGGEFTGSGGSVVKCVFRDNTKKPKTVTDLNLIINIFDSCLVDPIFYYRAVTEYFIRELVCRRIIKIIDNEIDDDFPAENFWELISGDKTNPADISQSNVHDYIRNNPNINMIRSNGFNEALNSLTAILHEYKIDYQFIEKMNAGQEVLIREYEDTDESGLPDEKYGMRIRYLDNVKLLNERQAHDTQFMNIMTKVRHLWDLQEVIYQDSKSIFRVNDFEDLAKRNKIRIRSLYNKDKSIDVLYDSIIKTWDDGNIFSHADNCNPGCNCCQEKTHARLKLAQIQERINNLGDFMNPAEKSIMEERLASLENEFRQFEETISPYQYRPGFIIDIDITTIKSRKSTLIPLANAMNKFVYSVIKIFRETGNSVSSLNGKASPLM